MLDVGRIEGVLLDIDGTLLDSNDAHAQAWVEAFAEHGVTVDLSRARRCIGMGGEKLMPEVSGVQRDSPAGAAIARRREEIFAKRYLPHLKPFSNAARLVAAHMMEPRDIREARSDLNPALADLVMACLAKDPDARPATARDVVRVLEMTAGPESATA